MFWDGKIEADLKSHPWLSQPQSALVPVNLHSEQATPGVILIPAHLGSAHLGSSSKHLTQRVVVDVAQVSQSTPS